MIICIHIYIYIHRCSPNKMFFGAVHNFTTSRDPFFATSKGNSGYHAVPLCALNHEVGVHFFAGHGVWDDPTAVSTGQS